MLETILTGAYTTVSTAPWTFWSVWLSVIVGATDLSVFTSTTACQSAVGTAEPLDVRYGLLGTLEAFSGASYVRRLRMSQSEKPLERNQRAQRSQWKVGGRIANSSTDDLKTFREQRCCPATYLATSWEISSKAGDLAKSKDATYKLALLASPESTTGVMDLRLVRLKGTAGGKETLFGIDVLCVREEDVEAMGDTEMITFQLETIGAGFQRLLEEDDILAEDLNKVESLARPERSWWTTVLKTVRGHWQGPLKGLTYKAVKISAEEARGLESGELKTMTLKGALYASVSRITRHFTQARMGGK
ncbi:hypothetical protein PV11_09048 [Exophiala sideris]|uniref:Uncharacterized protein n=1 Tax=Exophiala sideris TaxID=1016849 RepID=A0A0D1YQF6_9EURO|nr:hypothetical protein PV11_09048 [Exophiala sideris]